MTLRICIDEVMVSDPYNIDPNSDTARVMVCESNSETPARDVLEGARADNLDWWGDEEATVMTLAECENITGAPPGESQTFLKFGGDLRGEGEIVDYYEQANQLCEDLIASLTNS